MMDGADDQVFSFTFDLHSARQAFRDLAADSLVLALLATARPEPDWDGCIVYEGVGGGDPEATTCIGTRGPGAAAAQERLVEAFERAGLLVVTVYEGGPPVRRKIACARGGHWVAP